ncbi:WD repeat and FYVE domain-containing protein 2, partial [Exaiptasia diaphana]
FSAHMSVVTGICFSLEYEWLLSIGRDKYFQLHDTSNGKRIGGYQSDAWCTSMQFDAESKHIFIGDYAGHINILKVEDNSLSLVTTLKGHSGSIGGLAWDPEKKMLFSGSFDQSIIIWDIGGQQGTAFELQGHLSKIQALSYASHSKKLFSCSEDGAIMVWDMEKTRKETPEWSQCDVCERCGGPFFWNFKDMWNKKTVGVRQHHCRKCGRAVCNTCSEKQSSLPIMGFEYPVRCCNECYETITDEDREPLAIPHDGKHPIKYMHMDLSKARMLTCGGDRVVKVWDVKAILLS